MSENSGKCIDLSFLISMTGGNKERMSKYINLFLQNAPGLVKQMEDQLQQQDWASMKSTVHTLKSQFSYMGMAEAQALALQVERNTDEKTNLDSIPALVEKITDLFNRGSEELKIAITLL